MKKTLCLLFVLVLTVTVLAACAAEEPAPPVVSSVDIQVLADYLAAEENFGEPLYPLDENVARNVYQLDETVRCAARCGTGATAEECVIFQTADEAAADSLLELLKQRNDGRITSYASYMPDEVVKLENAILEARGTLVILCVAADPNAAAESLRAALDPSVNAAGALTLVPAE